MYKFTLAASLAVLAAGPALAQSFKLDSIEINGLKSINDAEVRPALKEHPGDTVTIDQIKADQDNLVNALQKVNVTGKVTTGLRDKKNGHCDIIFTVADNGIEKPVTTMVAPKLKDEVFVGNKAIDTATLTAASGLKPGDDLSNDKILAAQKAIHDAYVTAKVAADVGIAGSTVQGSDGTVTVTWTITETKKKKKKMKDMDDDGGLKTDD
jgi:outer membrane protein assembly factor BamA